MAVVVIGGKGTAVITAHVIMGSIIKSHVARPVVP